MSNLIEYSWNEHTQIAELVYEQIDGSIQCISKHQPLTITPDLNAYWGGLIWHLKTQGVDA